VKLGVALGVLNPAFHLEVAVEADRLGFESLWLPEHLVFPVAMSGSPLADDHPPVPPDTPVFDCFAYLSFLAARTEQIKLGSHVYLLGLRHPLVGARAVQTLDLLSGGRALFGVGAGWLESECRVAGVEFSSRGRRLEEAIGVCRRLWSEREIEHHGEFFDFEPVMFEPKPPTVGGPPVHVGGQSNAALRRAARVGDGWIGVGNTPAQSAELVERLDGYRRDAGSDDRPFENSVGAGVVSRDDLRRYEDAGVDRLVVAPWSRSPEAIDSLRRLAEELL
jgi:probable F420-dependent oxidoreductase